jgi:hypothetical protein
MVGFTGTMRRVLVDSSSNDSLTRFGCDKVQLLGEWNENKETLRKTLRK